MSRSPGIPSSFAPELFFHELQFHFLILCSDSQVAFISGPKVGVAMTHFFELQIETADQLLGTMRNCKYEIYVY